MRVDNDIRTKKDKLRNIIFVMCEGLVENRDRLKVDLVGSSSVILEITCAKEDVGKLIGKEGRNIQTMRNYATAYSSKYQFYTNIEIITENDFDRPVKYNKYNNEYSQKPNYKSYGRPYNRKFDRNW